MQQRSRQMSQKTFSLHPGKKIHTQELKTNTGKRYNLCGNTEAYASISENLRPSLRQLVRNENKHHLWNQETKN